MAAAGFGPPMVDRWEPCARRPSLVGENDRHPKCVRAEPLPEMPSGPRVTGAGRKARRPSVGGNGDSPRCVGVSGEGAMTTPSIRRLLSGFLIPDRPERFVLAGKV